MAAKWIQMVGHKPPLLVHPFWCGLKRKIQLWCQKPWPSVRDVFRPTTCLPSLLGPRWFHFGSLTRFQYLYVMATNCLFDFVCRSSCIFSEPSTSRTRNSSRNGVSFLGQHHHSPSRILWDVTHVNIFLLRI